MHALRADDFVSRHGGDEFVCLLPEEQPDEALAIGRQLIHSVYAPCQLEQATVHVRPSAGAALYPQDGLKVETRVQRADHAMPWAKARNADMARASPLPSFFSPLAARPRRARPRLGLKMGPT